MEARSWHNTQVAFGLRWNLNTTEYESVCPYSRSRQFGTAQYLLSLTRFEPQTVHSRTALTHCPFALCPNILCSSNCNCVVPPVSLDATAQRPAVDRYEEPSDVVGEGRQLAVWQQVSVRTLTLIKMDEHSTGVQRTGTGHDKQHGRLKCLVYNCHIALCLKRNT